MILWHSDTSRYINWKCFSDTAKYRATFHSRWNTDRSKAYWERSYQVTPRRPKLVGRIPLKLHVKAIWRNSRLALLPINMGQVVKYWIKPRVLLDDCLSWANLIQSRLVYCVRKYIFYFFRWVFKNVLFSNSCWVLDSLQSNLWTCLSVT